MKRSYWIFIIFVVITTIFAWLWLSGALHSRWLKYATEHQNWERVSALVRSGVNPNIYVDLKVPEYLVWSPLAVALYAGRHDIVKLLLEHKADPNMPGPFGAGPIYIPVFKHDLPMVALLFEYGANPEVSDRMWHDHGPFWSYLGDEHLQELKLFVKAGADITQKTQGKYLWDTESNKTNSPAVYEYLKNESKKRESI